MAANPVTPVPQLTIETSRSGDTVTIQCHGKVIANTTSLLQEEVRPLIADANTVVLDLTDVAYMDSSGLGTLVGLYISARRSGKHLKLVNLSDRVKELLRITRLISVFEGYGEYL